MDFSCVPIPPDLPAPTNRYIQTFDTSHTRQVTRQRTEAKDAMVISMGSNLFAVYRAQLIGIRFVRVEQKPTAGAEVKLT